MCVCEWLCWENMFTFMVMFIRAGILTISKIYPLVAIGEDWILTKINEVKSFCVKVMVSYFFQGSTDDLDCILWLQSDWLKSTRYDFCKYSASKKVGLKCRRRKFFCKKLVHLIHQVNSTHSLTNTLCPRWHTWHDTITTPWTVQRGFETRRNWTKPSTQHRQKPTTVIATKRQSLSNLSI